MRCLLAILSSLVLTAACAEPVQPPPPEPSPVFPAGELVDLSHTYDAETIFWPNAERFELRKDADGITDAGFYYAANSFFTAEHGGTHLDAPAHFAEGRETTDQVPLDRLIGPAVVVDVTAASQENVDYLITVDDLAGFEARHGEIAPGTILLFRTGFSSRWPDAERYLGTAERGEAATADLHFPGISPEAARWIVANRQVAAVGIDTASIDYGQSTLFETHRTLFAESIPAFENLAALDRLPETGAYVIALPMKIGGGSGGPLRAVAILP